MEPVLGIFNKETFKKGMKAGIEKGKKEIILSMLKQGFDLKAVTKATGLSKTEVNKIKASIKCANGAKKS